MENQEKLLIEIKFLKARIEELEKVEARLRDSEEKYKTLYDSSMDAVMILTPGEKFIAGNNTTLETFGCRSEEEFISKTPADLSPQYQPDGALSAVKAKEMMEIAMQKGSHYFEWLHKRLDGKEFYATVLLTRMQLRGEKVLQATVRDITRQKKVDEKLRQANEEWGRTFNAISDLIFIMDKEHTIINANQAFFDVVHVKPEDVVGKKCYEILHKLNKPWPECPLEKTRVDKAVHIQEVNDPAIGIPLLVTTSPVLDDKGELIAIVHVSKDISELKKTENELKKKIENLERFQKITVDRELRMKELKAQIVQLQAKLNLKQPQDLK